MASKNEVRTRPATVSDGLSLLGLLDMFSSRLQQTPACATGCLQLSSVPDLDPIPHEIKSADRVSQRRGSTRSRLNKARSSFLANSLFWKEHDVSSPQLVLRASAIPGSQSSPRNFPLIAGSVGLCGGSLPGTLFVPPIDQKNPNRQLRGLAGSSDMYCLKKKTETKARRKTG